MLTPAYNQVWGPNSIVPPEQRDEIYIVFAEESSATSLGPFGRFFLTSVLTGGKYKSIHICSASSIMYQGGGFNTVNGERSLLQDLKIHFTIDLAQQDIHDLFVTNSHSNQHIKGYTHICAKTLLQVPLIGYRRMFHWFTDYENITKFRDSYSSMCSISYPPNEMYNIKEKRREISPWNYHTQVTDDSGSAIRKGSSEAHTVKSRGDLNVNGTTHVMKVGDSSDVHSDRRRLRRRRALLVNDESLVTKSTGNTEDYFSASNEVKFSDRSSNNSRVSGSFHNSGDVSTEEYLTELEPGIKDDLEVVRDHGGLRKDPSVHNPFFKNITHSYVKLEVPPLHIVHKKGKQKLLVYQRDASRKVRGVNQFLESIRHRLSNENSTVENSSEWDVVLHSHLEDGSPCELVQKLSQTSAFVTAHGFQSFLLIYLPNTALVAEIFPALYYIPTYYGELQLTYRARFGFQRSYLSHESETMNNFIHYVTKLVWGHTQGCRRHFLCRHFSRLQDVKIPDDFTKTIATFLKYNFRK